MLRFSAAAIIFLRRDTLMPLRRYRYALFDFRFSDADGHAIIHTLRCRLLPLSLLPCCHAVLPLLPPLTPPFFIVACRGTRDDAMRARSGASALRNGAYAPLQI